MRFKEEPGIDAILDPKQASFLIEPHFLPEKARKPPVFLE
jgi:hypothetical protein